MLLNDQHFDAWVALLKSASYLFFNQIGQVGRLGAKVPFEDAWNEQ